MPFVVAEFDPQEISFSHHDRAFRLLNPTRNHIKSVDQGLARVVANAMTSTEPIDEAQLIVGVLKELDGPHIRALTTIRDADDANQLGPSLRDEILQNALKAQPYPVLAALARTGVVRQGSEERENGLYSITFADTLGITGISDFGRKLLADLESVTTNEV